MKLIDLLVREFNNGNLDGDFRVSRHTEICQFDCFSLEINFKRARSCNYGIPRLRSSFKKYYNACLLTIKSCFRALSLDFVTSAAP